MKTICSIKIITGVTGFDGLNNANYITQDKFAGFSLKNDFEIFAILFSCNIRIEQSKKLKRTLNKKDYIRQIRKILGSEIV